MDDMSPYGRLRYITLRKIENGWIMTLGRIEFCIFRRKKNHCLFAQLAKTKTLTKPT